MADSMWYSPAMWGGSTGPKKDGPSPDVVTGVLSSGWSSSPAPPADVDLSVSKERKGGGPDWSPRRKPGVGLWWPSVSKPSMVILFDVQFPPPPGPRNNNNKHPSVTATLGRAHL